MIFFPTEFYDFFHNIMDPVTIQPQSQFGIGFEDQGIYGKTIGQTTTLSGLEKLNQANEITILHKKISCVESNY